MKIFPNGAFRLTLDQQLMQHPQNPVSTKTVDFLPYIRYVTRRVLKKDLTYATNLLLNEHEHPNKLFIKIPISVLHNHIEPSPKPYQILFNCRGDNFVLTGVVLVKCFLTNPQGTGYILGGNPGKPAGQKQ